MERRSIRRIPVEAPKDVWLGVRVCPDRINFNTLFGEFSLPFAAVARWGGMATMVGGVLWIITFLLLQLWVYAYNSSSNFFQLLDPIMYFLDAKVPITAMSLLLGGLLGLFIRNRKSLNRLGKIGFCISLLGLVTAILATFVISMNQGLHLGGTDPSIISFSEWLASPFNWLWIGQPGHLILCIGLMIFGATLIRLRAQPTKGLALLISSAVLTQLPLAFLLALYISDVYLRVEVTYFIYDWLYRNGINEMLELVFVVLVLLFGAAWIWIGRALWSESPKPARKT